MGALFIGTKEIFSLFLVRFQNKVMLYVSSTFLLLVNAVTFRRVRNLYNRLAILILLLYGIIWCDNLNIALLDTWEGIYDGLFNNTSITHSFAIWIIGAIVLIIVYYPQTFTKINGSNGKENVFFLFNPIYK